MAEQPRTLLDDIGGPEVTRRAAHYAITAILADDDPELSVRPLFTRVIAQGGVNRHVGHLARSFEQLFGAGRSGRPLTEELLLSWHPASAGRCTQRQLEAVSAHMMDGFTLACPDEEAVGRVSGYFGMFLEAIRSVFLTPDELHLTNAERPPASRPARDGAPDAATPSPTSEGVDAPNLTSHARDIFAVPRVATRMPERGESH